MTQLGISLLLLLVCVGCSQSTEHFVNAKGGDKQHLFSQTSVTLVEDILFPSEQYDINAIHKTIHESLSKWGSVVQNKEALESVHSLLIIAVNQVYATPVQIEGSTSPGLLLQLSMQLKAPALLATDKTMVAGLIWETQQVIVLNEKNKTVQVQNALNQMLHELQASYGTNHATFLFL